MKKYKKYRLKKHIKRKLITMLLLIISVLLIKIGLNDYNNLAKECDQYYRELCTHYDINIYKIIKNNKK